MNINNVDDLREHLMACRDRLATSPNDGRDAAETALFALMQFAELHLTQAFGEAASTQSMTVPHKLLAAISDLDHGVTEKLLRAKRIPHRAETPLGRQVMKAHVAAAVDILIKHCECSKEDALKYAANHLSRSGIKQTSGKPIMPSTIASWRKHASEGSGDATMVREYRQLCASVPANGETWHQLADKMLGFASEDPLLKG